jgi:zinc/manganese transport system substrate-binding protein
MAKRILFLTLALSTMIRPAFGAVNVVATLPWIGSMAGEIGKDKVNITVLVKPNQDPHYVEAKPSMILAASRADVIMYNGLDLEVGYLPLIILSSRNPRIQPGQTGNLDCSKYVKPIEKPQADIDRSMGDVHPMGNPHYHYSARNMLRVAEGIEQALSQADPGNAAYYTANLATFLEKAGKKQNQWAGIPLSGKRFIAYHKLFEYLAAEYGFQIIGYVEPKPGIPPSAGYLQKLIETIKGTKPDGILTTPNYGRKEVELLAQKTGVRGVILPHDVGATPGAKDWFSFMDQTLSALVK